MGLVTSVWVAARSQAMNEVTPSWPSLSSRLLVFFIYREVSRGSAGGYEYEAPLAVPRFCSPAPLGKGWPTRPHMTWWHTWWPAPVCVVWTPSSNSDSVSHSLADWKGSRWAQLASLTVSRPIDSCLQSQDPPLLHWEGEWPWAGHPTAPASQHTAPPSTQLPKSAKPSGSSCPSLFRSESYQPNLPNSPQIHSLLPVLTGCHHLPLALGFGLTAPTLLGTADRACLVNMQIHPLCP